MRWWGAWLLGASLFGFNLYAETGARDVGLLSPQDRERIERAVLLAEQVSRERLRASAVTPHGPLAPTEAAGACGVAAEVIEMALRAQGVAPEQILQRDTSIHGEAYPHVFVVYRARSTTGEPILVVIDPTFTQTETHTFSAARGYVEGTTRSPGSLLARQSVGRDILNEIRKQGYWIPTRAGFEAWQHALQLPLPTGTVGDGSAPLTWEQFQTATTSDLRASAPNVAFYLGLQNTENATDAIVLSEVQRRLAAMSSADLAQRREVGLCLQLEYVARGEGFIRLTR